MAPPEHPTVVGMVELCRRLGAKRDTVNKWRARGTDGFPQPRWTIGGDPAWDWAEVEAWAERTHRLPTPG